MGWTKVAWLPWVWKGTPGLVLPLTGVGVIWGFKEDPTSSLPLEQLLLLYPQYSEIPPDFGPSVGVLVGSEEGGKVTSAECERSAWLGNPLLGTSALRCHLDD